MRALGHCPLCCPCGAGGLCAPHPAPGCPGGDRDARIWDWRWGTALERSLWDVRVWGSAEGGEEEGGAGVGAGQGAGRDLRGLWVTREELQVTREAPGDQRGAPGDQRGVQVTRKGLQVTRVGLQVTRKGLQVTREAPGDQRRVQVTREGLQVTREGLQVTREAPGDQKGAPGDQRGSRCYPGDQRGSRCYPGDQRGSRCYPGDQRGSRCYPGDQRGCRCSPGEEKAPVALSCSSGDAHRRPWHPLCAATSAWNEDCPQQGTWAVGQPRICALQRGWGCSRAANPREIGILVALGCPGHCPARDVSPGCE
ncbi:uncharacterized protein LOC130263724 isoform X6 [Oenanthe melanoleuca]|uniref:uncharacterized protein LOC130263724 isoform X6 n=1 Tax=Oenanthe melanoleuca TaxID=2939378 RepID=UPI0024C14ED2|nr:uncharacterized protein LOC130263724 isoform X6 [Oenanthe melanoleuca]